MNFFTRIIRKVSNSSGFQGDELATLKKRVLLEKKKQTNQVRQTNDTIKVMIERGELELRIIRNKKK